MKKAGIALITALLISSCMTIPKMSQFEAKGSYIGMKKDEILSQFGKPFMREIHIDSGDTIEVVYYKEPVRVANCPYVITTALYFKNSVLTRFEQKDRLINNIEISTDSIK